MRAIHNELNPEYVKELIQWVNQSPFPRHMSMRMSSVAPEGAELTMDIGNDHFQVYGLVHGGALATLVDTATFWAVFPYIGEDDGLVNVELKLNYLKPVTQGPLSAKGRCIRSGRTLSYAEARIFDAETVLCAHGTSTLMTLPGKGVRLKHAKFCVG